MKPSSSGLPGWHLRSSRHRERTSAFERHTAGEMTKAVQPRLRKKGGPLIGQNNWLWEEWTGPFMTLRTHARALSSTLVQSVQDCSGAPLNSFPWASKALPAVPASAITVAGCCPVVSTQIYGRPICTCAGRRLLPTASYSGERPDIPAAWPAQRSHAHACDGALWSPCAVADTAAPSAVRFRTRVRHPPATPQARATTRVLVGDESHHPVLLSPNGLDRSVRPRAQTARWACRGRAGARLLHQRRRTFRLGQGILRLPTRRRRSHSGLGHPTISPDNRGVNRGHQALLPRYRRRSGVRTSAQAAC